MKQIRNTLLISAFASLLFSVTATACGGGFVLADMDTDKNGLVSEKEFNTAKAKRIAARVAEGRKMRGLANAPTFATFDINKDGKLTADEIDKMKQARWTARKRLPHERGKRRRSRKQRNGETTTPCFCRV